MNASARLDRARRRDESFLHSLVVWGRTGEVALGLVAVTLLLLLAIDSLVYEPRLDRAIEGTAAVRVAHEAMLDQQVGLRGYLLSGEEQFLEAYERGRRTLAEIEPEATRILGTSDGVTGLLFFQMRLAQRDWLDDWAAEALELGGEPAAVTDRFIGEDKKLFDAYRRSYDALIDRLVEQRADALHDQRQALVLTIGFALAVTLAAAVLAQRGRRVLYRSVEHPLHALLERVEQIGGNDLDARPIPPGPTEFQSLAAGLESTAAALAASRAETDLRAAQLAARSRRQAEVLSLAREVAGSLSLRYVLRGVCARSSAVADGARVVVWLMHASRQQLDAIADSNGPDLAPVGREAVPIGDGSVGRAGQYGRMQGRGPDDTDGILAVPMVVGAQVIGVLQFDGDQVDGLSDDALAVLETMAIHAATAIDAARLHERTSTMAMTDVLTGLPNRRRLDDDLRVECAASSRYNRPLTFLMVDVDHFKSYNDTYGHQAGDVALQSVGRILGEGLRSTDQAYRYGGEEFAFILRETGADGALIIAERLPAAIEHFFSGPEQPRVVTISIGLASLPGPDPTPGGLIAAADDALYRAKQSGRNRVAVAMAPPPLETLRD